MFLFQMKKKYRLNELKNWFKSCKYSENVINRAFRNARLQGSATLKRNSNNISFAATYYDNVNYNEKVKKILRQPKSLLRLLSKARSNTDTNNFMQLNGYLNVQINAAKFVRCMLMRTAVMSNNMGWEFRSYVICMDIN